jgi:hypothetical protein
MILNRTNQGRVLSAASISLLFSPLLAVQQSELPTLKTLETLIRNRATARSKVASDPLGYGSDLFFYVNWPAQPSYRGRPDAGRKFGDTGTTVWETWKNSAEVYLRCGGRPESWNAVELVPPSVLSRPLLPSDSGKSWQNMTSNVQADGLAQADLQRNDLLYEIRLNDKTFDYILKNKIYNIDGQVSFAWEKGDLDFAFDAVEAKASWHWLDPNETTAGCRPQDYFTANAYYAQLDNNGKVTGYKTGLMGLTGLHIITKAVPQWVWITFEQKNNPQCIGVNRVTPISPDVVAENQAMAPIMQQSGKWANYQLVGVQTSAGRADKPLLLANTQIESAFQSRSSCLTCHQFASVATHFPVQPEDNLRMPFIDPGVTPPYYIGPAPPLGAPYKAMDFVWSLRRAFRLEPTGCVP